MATERSVKVRVTVDERGFLAGMRNVKTAVSDVRREIDTTNDRTAWLAQSFLALAPALGPLGAAAVPALAGLATQMTIAGVAAGTMTLAFNGIGDALKALNEQRIDPTDAHLKKLHETMGFIGPTGRDLVRVLDELRGGLVGLAYLSRDKMFPGVIEGLEELRVLGPQVQQIVAKTADVLGELADRGGEKLAGPEFEDFFNFLEADAVPILDQMARSLGNVFSGIGAMLSAFAPLSRDFSGGMLEMTRAFSEWAHGLQDNDSFQSFLDYVRENTPKVVDLIAQIADTFIALVQAGAPVGELILPILEQFLGIIETLSNSPLGPIFIGAAAAMSIYGRAAALASITTGGFASKVGGLALGIGGLSKQFNSSITVMGKHRKALETDMAVVGRHAKAYQGAASGNRSAVGRWTRALAPAATSLGIFAFAASGAADKVGLANAANYAMIGSLAGPWGAAIGGAIGLLKDMSSNAAHVVIDQEALAATLDQQTGAITKNTDVWVANELAKQGALAAAARLGIDGGLLVDAALGDTFAVERLARAYDQLEGKMVAARAANEITAGQMSDFRTDSQLLSSAFGSVGSSLDKSREKMNLVGEALDTTTRKYHKVADAVDYLKLAQDRLNGTLDRRAAFRAYQESLDALARGIRDNGKTLDQHTKKGRDNQAALDGIVQSILDVSDKLKGTARTEFLKHAREDFVDSAKKLGLTEKAARNLADELGLLDLVRAKPVVVAPKGIQQAHSDIDKLDTSLRILDKFVARPRIVLARDTNWNFGEGPGFAGGGWTGDMPPTQAAGLVHGKEFVVPAPYAERDRAELEARYLPGYAKGGFVEPSRMISATPTVTAVLDRDDIASLMGSGAPYIGHATFNSNGDYDRAEHRARRMRGAGGRAA